MSMNFNDEHETADSDVALTGVVKVGGRPFAVGLQWHNADEKPAKEARAALRASEGIYNIFCARGGASPQFGLGSTMFGQSLKMPSLAAHVADHSDGSWLGAFRVPQGVYFLAVKDDSILAESDRVFAEDDAQQFFRQYLKDGSWNHRVAPASWGIPDTQDIELEQMVRGKSRSVMRPASAVNLRLVAGVTFGIALVAAGSYGYSWYQSYLDDQRLEALRLVMAQKAAREPAIVPVPWEGTPAGVDLLATCVKTLAEHNFEVAGWDQAGASCQGDRATVVLRRAGGTINWIAASVNSRTFKPNIVPQGNTSALVSWVMPALNAYPQSSPGGRLALTQRYLLSQLDERFTEVKFGAETKGNGYAKVGFTFSTRADPREFIGLLYPVPALTLKQVTREPNGQWNIEGEFYERRPIQPPASN